MEYLIIIALIIFGIIKHDFKDNQQGIGLFRILCIFMVLMSGLAYRVGADLVRYEQEFEYDYRGSIFSLEIDISEFSSRQPGWTILNYLVYCITGNFYVLKMIQAVFFQYAVFVTIKRFTPYKFTSLLFFFVFLFPQANFNVLRESFAIGFFLLGIPSLVEKNFKQYYLWIFAAFLFHYGVLPFVFLPLAFLLDFKSPKRIVIISIVLFVSFVTISTLDITKALLSLVAVSNSNELSSISEYYLLKEKYEVSSYLNILKSLLFYVINIFPLFALSKKKTIIQKELISLAFVFVLISLSNDIIPIMYRFKDYLYVLYFIVLSVFIVDFSIQKLIRSIPLTCLVFALYLYPIRSYFAVNPWYNEKLLVQYYPYHSIIDKGYSQVREQVFYRNY